MTPEALRILRFQLPPYGEGAHPSAELRAFCSFYGIDFVGKLPGVTHLAGHVQSGPHRIAVQHWRQPDAVANLLIVHGYYDHTGLFGKLAEWGLVQGCNVLCFDLPGHGLSTGEPAVIDDFGEYSQAIHAVLSQVWLPELPLWVMAQSTGCAALIDFARRYDWPFKACVLLAPLVRPAGWLGVRVAHSALRHFTDSIPRKFANNTSDSAFLEFVEHEPLQCHRVPLSWVAALRRWLAGLERRDLGVGPALVVQGRRDNTVDWRHNVPFVQDLFPGSQLVYINDAGHQLANESVGLRRDYLERVTLYLDQCGISLGQRVAES